MTAHYAAMYNQSGYCMASAAAGTSAGFDMILDTVILAVSIILVRLIALVVLKV